MELFFENPNFVNTSEAISDFIALGKSDVIIPYYNLALMNYNPINQKSSFVKNSFYIFKQVHKILFRSENVHFEIQFSDNAGFLKKDYLVIGGLRNEMKGAEIEIDYLNSILYIPTDSELSIENFEKLDILDFLPNNLIDMIGPNYYKLII